MRFLLVAVLCACGQPTAAPDAPVVDPDAAVDAAMPDAIDAMPDASPDAAIVGTPVTIHTYRDSDAQSAALVAFVTDTTAWTAVTGTAGVYSFGVIGGRYGVAVVCAGATDQTSTVTLLFATTTERTSHDVNCGPDPVAQHHVTGSITGWNSNLFAKAYARGGSAAISSASYDVVADGGTTDLGFTTQFPSKIKIDRGVAVPANVTHDIDLATSFDAETHTLSFMGAQAGDSVGAEVYYLTQGGTAIKLLSLPNAMVPTAQQQGDEIHYIVTDVWPIDSQTPTESRVMQFVKAPANLVVATAPALADPVVTATSTPYKRPSITFTKLANAEAYGFAAKAFNLQSYAAIATTGWLGTTSTITIPDLSGVAGWRTGWGLDATGQASWAFTAMHSTAGLDADLFVPFGRPPPPNLDGRKVIVSKRRGSI